MTALSSSKTILETTVLRRARKQGGRVFLVGAMIQVFVTLAIIIPGIWMDYSTSSRNNGSEGALWGFLYESRYLTMGKAFLAAMVLYGGLAWLLGRWAGRRIQVQKSYFWWVGPLTMLLPSLLASTVFVLWVDLVYHRQILHSDQRFNRDFIEPILFITGFWAVCAIPPSILAGLAVRQYGRLAEEKAERNTLTDTGIHHESNFTQE